MYPESRLRLKFTDMNNTRALDAEVRPSMTVEQTIKRLLHSNFIRPLEPGEEYVLILRREQRRLTPTQTLHDAGVRDDDVLVAGALMLGG